MSRRYPSILLNVHLKETLQDVPFPGKRRSLPATEISTCTPGGAYLISHIWTRRSCLLELCVHLGGGPTSSPVSGPSRGWYYFGCSEQKGAAEVVCHLVATTSSDGVGEFVADQLHQLFRVIQVRHQCFMCISPLSRPLQLGGNRPSKISEATTGFRSESDLSPGASCGWTLMFRTSRRSDWCVII